MTHQLKKSTINQAWLTMLIPFAPQTKVCLSNSKTFNQTIYLNQTRYIFLIIDCNESQDFFMIGCILGFLFHSTYLHNSIFLYILEPLLFTSEKRKEELSFVTKFRANLAGRMNCIKCLAEGQPKSLFKRYSTGVKFTS
ncbi:hypothetical protein F4703DRAFT_1897411 [Phycomyces blakesleeanus]